MRITRLVLHNYVRFSLNNITDLVYTPDKDMQIILGQNGSGKSSLLEQLLPVCNNAKKDFNTDGYRELHFTHNNREYVLRNTQNGKHSFIIDSSEYNTGGTRVVQNQLIKEHTGITPNIQRVLLGGKLFTRMSPMERKEWLTEMSAIDYTYPVSVYNKLRTEHRDIVGGIKLLQANITRATQTMLSEELLDKLTTDRKYTAKLIDHLLRLIRNVEDGVGYATANKEVRLVYAKLSKDLTGTSGTNIEALKDKYSKHQLLLSESSDRITKLTDELYRIKNTVDTTALPELTTQRTRVSETMVSLLADNPYRDMPDATTANYILDNYANIVSIISKINDANLVDYSKERLNKLTDARTATAERIELLNRQGSAVRAELKHISKHHGGSLVCPECSHTWTPSTSDTVYKKLEAKLSGISDSLVVARDELTKIDMDINDIATVRGHMGELATIFSINEDTRLVMASLLQSNTFKTDGVSGLFTAFEQAMGYIKDIAKVNEHKTELSRLDTEIDKIGALATMANEVRAERIANLTDEIAKCVEAKRVHQNQLTDITRDLHKLASISELKAELGNKIKLTYRCKDKAITAVHNHYLEKAISALRQLLVDIDDQLKDNNDRLHMLGKYQAELTTLNTKERVLSKMIKALSPSTGLIAKSISSFLNVFLDDLNSIISEVWEYPMELLPCDISEDDLDYKFKVLVNNSEVVSDISNTSAGMSEIINLAFKVVFCKYMGLSEFPLILDEFGRTFDAAHRVKAYDTLDRSLSGIFSQIYIVSHYESMYGRFVNADISVMDAAGVDMSTVANYNNVLHIE